ncbi:MAG: hypothetical protein C0476_06495 [Sphingomonas sp.]|nr:hypothetical protein [Sphingomonas sp.]
MRLTLFATLLPIAFGIVGCAETPRQKAASIDREAADALELAQTLQGYSAGPAEECIPQLLRRYQTSSIGKTILYRVDSRLIYRNDTTGCQQMPFGDILVSQNPGPQLCRGQIITTIDGISRVQTGSCALGEFVPYRKPKP